VGRSTAAGSIRERSALQEITTKMQGPVVDELLAPYEARTGGDFQGRAS
jgi:hypothetical protein